MISILKKQKKSLVPGKEGKLEKRALFTTTGELVVDVYQTEKDFFVRAPIAGVKKEDIEILVENDTLNIKGRRQEIDKVKEENYLVKECYWGPFSKEIILPQEINESKIEASINQGILIIKLPKKKVKRNSKIEIKTIDV